MDDLPVAREALLTARHLGRPTKLIADIGIAGLHRLQSRLPELREAACVVVAAGMDGALPTVVEATAAERTLTVSYAARSRRAAARSSSGGAPS